MAFSPGGSSSASVSSSTDVSLSNPLNAQVLTYDGALAKWKNATVASSNPSYANLPAGSTLTVLKNGATWPVRPTDRSDIIVQWKGVDPAPGIVTTGTAGMRDGVDVYFRITA